MVTCLKKKIFLLIFCLASITQGMYSTYFVSILTTIERIYQIRSKTAGAILSATEIGQILGSLLIAYYGGKGNKPKWIAACMTLSAIAALISILPHFILSATNHDAPTITGSHGFEPLPVNQLTSPYQHSDLSERTVSSSLHQQKSSPAVPAFLMPPKAEPPSSEQLCRVNELTDAIVLNSTQGSPQDTMATALHPADHRQTPPVGLVLVIFFVCLLTIGFGSTAITTLGIPFIDDIVSKEESPLYLGLTIGLKIFGPALGFLLGSFCIRLDANVISLKNLFDGESQAYIEGSSNHMSNVGAWWLGLIMISLPLLILAIPMYYLPRMMSSNGSQRDNFEDITYQAAEDHDIGGSHDFQAHMLTVGGDLDVTSNRTCFSSQIDSSSREVLQSHQPLNQYHQYNNYGRNIALEQPILTQDSVLTSKTKLNDINGDDVGEPSVIRNNNGWRASICAVVNHFGGLESTSFTNDEASSLNHHRDALPCAKPSSSSSITALSRSSIGSGPYQEAAKQQRPQQQKSTIMDLLSILSRLIKNKLLLLRMLSGILHIIPIAGFYTFFPKYLIEQFRITLSSASAISGLAGILFVGFGAFLGGTIVRLFNVNSKLVTRWIASSALLYTMGMLILMNLGCDKNQTVYHGSQEFVSTDCSTLCKCSSDIYNPVCANGTTYISPCLAGCKSYTISKDGVIFDECGCSSLVANTSVTSTRQTHIVSDHLNLNVATQGHCLVDCDNLKWYIIVFSVSTLIHASCEVGSMMFNLRCVKSNDRTLALGLITFASSLFGKCALAYLKKFAKFVNGIVKESNCSNLTHGYRRHSLLSHLWNRC